MRSTLPVVLTLVFSCFAAQARAEEQGTSATPPATVQPAPAVTPTATPPAGGAPAAVSTVPDAPGEPEAVTAATTVTPGTAPSATDFVTRELRAYFLDQGKTWLGAGELILSQASIWGTVGAFVGGLSGASQFGPGSGPGLVAGGLVGAIGAGLYIAASDGVTAGQSSFITTAGGWGTLLALVFTLPRPGIGVSPSVVPIVVAPAVATLLATASWGRLLSPTAGQVQLTSTLGMYAAGIGAMIFFGAAGLPLEHLVPVVLGTASVGLAAGAFLSWKLRPTRIWAMTVSSVGAVSALGTFMVMALLRASPGPTPGERIPFFVIPSAVTAAAMATAIAVPFRWRDTLGEVLVTPSATREGGGLMLIGRF